MPAVTLVKSSPMQALQGPVACVPVDLLTWQTSQLGMSDEGRSHGMTAGTLRCASVSREGGHQRRYLVAIKVFLFKAAHKTAAAMHSTRIIDIICVLAA